MQYRTIQYNKIQYKTIQIQYSATKIPYHTIQNNLSQYCFYLHFPGYYTILTDVVSLASTIDWMEKDCRKILKDIKAF